MTPRHRDAAGVTRRWPAVRSGGRFFGPAQRGAFHALIGWTSSPAHYRALRMIEASRLAPPTITEIGGALVTDPARASRIVTELHDAGLVDRRTGVVDRRRREVVLTDAGREALADARRLRLEVLALALREWDDDDVGQLAELLVGFNAAIRSLEPYVTTAPGSGQLTPSDEAGPTVSE